MVSRRDPADVFVACSSLATAARYGHLLSAEETAHAASCPPRRAREFSAGRALLRWALARSLGPWAASSRVALTERGKPVLADLPATGISLSHGGGTVAAAVAVGRAVGIDVQGPVPVTEGLLRRCCTPEQQGELAALAPEGRPAALARRWVIHEAHAKATGRGLTRRPGRFPGPLLAHSGQRQGFVWRVLPPVGPCAAAVVFDGPAESVCVRVALLTTGDGTDGRVTDHIPGNRKAVSR